MKEYICDGCGKHLATDALRYTVKIDVRAAYDQMEVGLVDLVRDHRNEILALIEKLKDKDASEIEETIYKGFKLDLCPSCQRAFVRDPLRFHPEQGPAEDSVDIDSFLRSLGLPNKDGGGSGEGSRKDES